jgi:hypothetical protein
MVLYIDNLINKRALHNRISDVGLDVNAPRYRVAEYSIYYAFEGDVLVALNYSSNYPSIIR